MIGMSACLAGVNCKYNGGNNLREACRQLAAVDQCLLICPEVITSLGCPREAAEVSGEGGGDGVWQNKARVITVGGKDVTAEFKQGALSTLDLIRSAPNIELVILQSRSPSCGVNSIYDGSFSGRLIAGDGVLASLLKQHGIKLLDVEEYLKKDL